MTRQEAIEQIALAWWAAENEYGSSPTSLLECLAAIGVTEDEFNAATERKEVAK